MAKARRKVSQGLGDSIEKVTEVTGIKAVVKLFADVTGIDCGCDERKEKLNKLFPYNKPNCLIEDDYNYLTAFFKENPNQITPLVQRDLSGIYLRVFKIHLESSNCPSCWRDYISQLQKIYNEYASL
jgi:hypothetical protein